MCSKAAGICVLFAFVVGCGQPKSAKPLGDTPAHADPVGAFLKEMDPNDLEGAKRALQSIPGPTFEAVVAALKSKDPDVRWRAAVALGALQDRRAVGPLLSCLKGKEIAVREHAAAALGEIGDARAVQPLIGTLPPESGTLVGRRESSFMAQLDVPDRFRDAFAKLDYRDSRWVAARALGQIKAPSAVPALVRALNDTDYHLQHSAAWALGEIADARAVADLVAALKQGNNAYINEPLRKQVREALCKIGTPAVEPLIGALRGREAVLRRDAAEVLGRLKDARAVQPLACLLSDDEEREVQSEAAAALGRIGEPGIETLTLALSSENWNVRRSAAGALGDARSPRAVDALVKALEDKDGMVQTLVAQALGEIRDQRAVPPLSALLKGESRELREAAAWALAKIKYPTDPQPLNAAVTSRDLPIIAGAYRYLIMNGSTAAEDALVEALGQHGDIPMAQVYLNCRNKRLEEAARKWAADHGVGIGFTSDPPKVLWGRR